MIGVKDALGAAQAFVRDLYPEEELRHLRLEEVDLSSDERVWNITLSWVEKSISKPSVLGIYGGGGDIQKLPRVYKVFEVDAESGTVRSMKMYKDEP
jgi:hypothetical protein